MLLLSAPAAPPTPSPVPTTTNVPVDPDTGQQLPITGAGEVWALVTFGVILLIVGAAIVTWARSGRRHRACHADTRRFSN